MPRFENSYGSNRNFMLQSYDGMAFVFRSYRAAGRAQHRACIIWHHLKSAHTGEHRCDYTHQWRRMAASPSRWMAERSVRMLDPTRVYAGQIRGSFSPKV